MKQLQNKAEELFNQFIRDFYLGYEKSKTLDINQIQSYFNQIKIRKLKIRDQPVTMAVHCNHSWIHFLLIDKSAENVVKTSPIAVVLEVKISDNKISKIQLRPGKGSVIKSSDFSEGLFDLFLSLQIFLNNQRK